MTTFCPPPELPKNLLTTNTNSLIANVLINNAQATLPPTTSISTTTTLAPPLKRKRAPAGSAVNANGIKKVRKTTKQAISPPQQQHTKSKSKSPSSQARTSESGGRTPVIFDDDDEPEIDYTTWGTRKSTPVPQRPDWFPYGQREDWTVRKHERTDFQLKQLRCGANEDGNVDCKSSEKVVKPIIGKFYRTYFKNLDDPNDTTFNLDLINPPTIELEYPNYSATEKYILLAPHDKDHYNPILELMNAIHSIIGLYLLPHEQIPFGTLPLHLQMKMENLPPPITPTSESKPLELPSSDHLRNLEKAFNTRNGPLFVQTVDAINVLLRAKKEAMMHHVHCGWEGVPSVVWKAVVEECYQRCIGPNVRELAKYTPFSNEVYGELNASFISDIIWRTNLKANSVFVDLGCGVGNCLIQAALQVGCTALGVEINPPPATLGISQVEEFKKRIRKWGLCSGKVELRQADFCEDEAVRTWIPKADVVLVNNWAFSAQLNEKLSLMFLDLPEGAQIVSLKPFRRSDFRLTDRTVSSPAAILKVEEVEFRRGAVSWMAEGGVYYLHTVDRDVLRKFIERTESMAANAVPKRRRKGRDTE